MEVRGYRDWQSWQQMHYPRRGLPPTESARSELLAIDGIAGAILERKYRRRGRQDWRSGDAVDALQRCQLALDRLGPHLSGDATRYFARLRLLIGIVLAGDQQAVPG